MSELSEEYLEHLAIANEAQKKAIAEKEKKSNLVNEEQKNGETKESL
jgi:hypothetical protein